tara:strand:- start:318 stop:854 length:537 start_codon:yes stop_codon:yes gene_type:complete
MASRVLVSNLGDGNWVAPDNSLLGAELATARTIYFPPGAAKGTAPVPGGSGIGPMTQQLGFVGWSAKTHFIVQVRAAAAANYGTGTFNANFPAASIVVNAVRPTGVKEQLMVSTAATAEDALVGNVLTETYGAYGAETIEGPVSYFEFYSNATGGSLDVDCFVIAWNYGDISDGLATP